MGSMASASLSHQNHARRPVFIRLVVILAFTLRCESYHATVCSYNLWNVMFGWEIRVQHIANMISDAGCEIVVLQEVRIHQDGRWSQAHSLWRLLPKFKWMVAHAAGSVSKPASAYWDGWEKEGLAVISQWPIGAIRVEQLSTSEGPDTNKRIILHVPVFISRKAWLHIVAVHFSYNRQQQCLNAAEVLRYINRSQLSNVIIAGDLNIYSDFPDPAVLITDIHQSSKGKTTRCTRYAGLPLGLHGSLYFSDVWEAIHGSEDTGFTFSNMPTPGLVSRPDRIFASSDLSITHASLHGNGTEYAKKHRTDILLHRFWTVIHAARDAAFGQTGYSCLQDCGPNGVCRCGVCVRKSGIKHGSRLPPDGGSLETCLIPHCEECTSAVYFRFCALSAVVCVLVILAGIAAVKVLVVSAHFEQTVTVQLYGCNCCLCNPKLVTSASFTNRSKLGRCLRCLGCGRLPPAILLLLCLSWLGMCLAIGLFMFQDSLNTVTSLMAEELFPSDHFMLMTAVSWS